MQFFTGISRNNQSKSLTNMLPLTKCVWDFQNNALWDTHENALLIGHVEMPSHYLSVPSISCVNVPNWVANQSLTK